jgi:N-methylhydantoinase A
VGSLVGIDVGGTFTDLAYAHDGRTISSIVKVPSTPDDSSRGVLDALRAAQVEQHALEAVLHGTTIATNAVIERTGARCALITTKGFRDVLELGRRDRINLYGMTGVQEPLIPRDDRWEVDERIDFQGQELRPVDRAGVLELAEHLKAEGIGVVVVSLLHSYADPTHEEQVRDLLLEVSRDWHVVISSSVVTEYYEFERTSSAVVQGYLQPLVARYAANLRDKLDEEGFKREVLVMQSNGGVVPIDRLGSRASHIIRSGPAAGVIAAGRLAAEVGFDKIITGDMGGTSFDVAVVIDGEPGVSETTQLDFRIPLRIPMIDVHTIGAGGGSIASIDRGGVLEVGPRSAGSQPGPICFRRGGTEPTVTDANVVLGRINAQSPIGAGENDTLDVEGARAGMARLGAELGLGPEETAEAILDVVNTRMAGRMRLITVEQGHDPRDFALVAFGGAGPVHGAALLRNVGVRTMLVPSHPGVLCAMGCLMADLRYDYSRTVERRIDQLAAGELSELFEAQRAEGERQLHGDGVTFLGVTSMFSADMAYLGQVHRLRVRVKPDWGPDELREAFLQAYQQEFGTLLGEVPVLLVNIRTSVRGVRQGELDDLGTPADRPAPDPTSTRPVYFLGEWHETAVYERTDLLPGVRLDGPAIVEQADTTTVIEPGMSLWIDGRANLQVELTSEHEEHHA